MEKNIDEQIEEIEEELRKLWDEHEEYILQAEDRRAEAFYEEFIEPVLMYLEKLKAEKNGKGRK